MRYKIAIAAGLSMLGVAKASDAVQLDLNAAAKEYCHILRFPLGWQMPPYLAYKAGGYFVPGNFGLDYDYEFRVPGLQGTRFLVRGVERIGDKYYTTNMYEADFADPPGVARPATEEQWNSGTPVPFPNSLTWSDVLGYLNSIGFDYMKKNKSGDKGPTLVLSPARDVVVLQSFTGTLGRCGGSDIPGDLGGFCIDFRGPHGKLFFDVYNTDTGKKL